ncbi:anthranilate phosphoribosyltransferase [Pseudalkalibacillus caeni]|uniref:Anthranilate phosphoribosyltransferase n=1 Tax=Exobacillus caeni TaxID=2574798 RepID=A0A5R9F0H3_9BACL|nr:anthranilate phosphoribosyltransferase [Pseudalkalibacillus caeni]TLS35910.1 anthranilate phosphoribosyltransferase [Pseudalkalibacillus caeni]
MFKKILSELIDGKRLSETEAKEIMDVIMNGQAEDSQIASLLTVLRLRGETVDELTGFIRSLRGHVLPLEHDIPELIDTCGTGGDGASTFNISTATAILLSSLGVNVAKHGNRAVSSKSGSADVLEHLEIPIQQTPQEARSALERTNMCFLFAPQYHVAMKHAVKARKQIGFRTVFNCLGPMANPAGSNYQLIGVYDADLALKMAEAMKRVGAERVLFVTGGEGLDECSITTHTTMVELNNGKIDSYQFIPEDMGIKRGSLEDIQVSTVKESAELIKQIFSGEANEAATNVVALNAGACLYLVGRVDSIAEGVKTARNALAGGVALEQLKRLQYEKELKLHA